MTVVALAIVSIWVVCGLLLLARSHRDSITFPFRAWQREVRGERVRTEAEVFDPGLARRHIYGIQSRHRIVLRFYDERNAPVTVIEQHQVFRPLTKGMRIPVAYDPVNPMGRGAIDDFGFYRNWAPFLATLTIWVVGLVFGGVLLVITL